MMKRSFSTIALWTLLIACIPTAARTQSYGTELPFVLGTGAKSSMLGVASAGFLGDASVQYHNPSALSYLEWRQFVFYRSTLFDSESVYHAVSYAHPLINYGTVGFGLMRVDVGGIEERDDNNQLLSSDLHNSQTRILLGFARHLSAALAAGVNLKIDNQSFGSFGGSGLGLDVGLLARQGITGHSFIRGLRGALVIQNLIEPSVRLDQEKVSDPMSFALGISALSVFDKVTAVTSLDLVNPRFSPFSLRFGQELLYLNRYALRFAIDDISPNYGFGAKYKNLALDYAYRSEDFGGNHRISLSVRFGPSLSEIKTRDRLRLEAEVSEQISTRIATFERDQIVEALEAGDRLLTAGDYDKARNHFETALLWDAENEHASDSLRRTNYQIAIKSSRDAIAKEDFTQALLDAKKALGHVPEDAEATNMIRICEQHIQNTNSLAELSIHVMKSAIDLYADRQFLKALAGFEEVLNIDKDHKLAMEYRDKCNINIQNIVQRHILDARALAERKDYSGAIRRLEQALQYQRQTPMLKAEIDRYTNLRRAATLSAVQDTPSAQDNASSQQQNNLIDTELLEGHYQNGMRMFEKGDYQQAVTSLLKVWTQASDFHNVTSLLTQAYLFLGMRHYSQDNYAEALRVWEKVLTIDPFNEKARRYLKRTQEEMKVLHEVKTDP
jgi:tetratricopeptide (TPR) repeat protein